MKSEKNKKLKIVKCKDLRVYKDNARPVVFKDKRRSEKYKKKYFEEESEV